MDIPVRLKPDPTVPIKEMFVPPIV